MYPVLHPSFPHAPTALFLCDFHMLFLMCMTYPLLHAVYHMYTLHILHALLHIQIPAELYDLAIKQLQTMDPEAVDTLLKRKCMDQGYVHTTHSATSIKCSHMHLSVHTTLLHKQTSSSGTTSALGRLLCGLGLVS